MEFDPARTLIGGPNESGKSTLIEAVHRALFLKAQVTGEPQRSMVSRIHSGHPEVEVEFQVEGVRYHLFKRFSGQSGIARLTRAGGHTWHNEEAEAMLRDLLGVPEIGGGRGVAERVRQQWAHLWVWQGTSTQDPCQSAREQNDRLLQELQRRGGAVVMQSELDSRVAAECAEKAAAEFVIGGRPRAGSDLDVAARERDRAQAACDRAAGQLAALGRTVAEYQEADDTVKRSTKSLADIDGQLEGTLGRLELISSLRHQEELRAEVLRSCVDALSSLQKAEEDIREVRQALAQIRAQSKPEEEHLNAFENERAELERKLDEAWQVYEAATTGSRDARRARDLALAYVAWFEQDEACRRLEEVYDRVRSLEGEIEQARRDTARLPEVTEDVLDELRRLEAEAAQAAAALSGVAAEIETVDAPLPVIVGGEMLVAGRSRTVTEPTEVRVGDCVTLRIRPGGGVALAQARERLRRSDVALREALESAGVESLSQAGEVWALRRVLENDIGRAEAALRALVPEGRDLSGQLQSAQDGRSSAEADIGRLAGQMADASRPPETRGDAQSRLRRQEAAVLSAEEREADGARQRDELKARLEEAGTCCAACREAVAGFKSELATLEVKERLLVESHGHEHARHERLATARADRDRAEAALADARARLEQLQPEQQEADRKRLERARTEAESRRSDGLISKEVALSRLRTEGTEDPYAELARAEADLAVARDHYEAVRRRAEAVRLLDRLFSEEQRALSERLSRPLAESIESYAQRLFGPDTAVTVEFAESGVTGVELVRSGQHGATGFDSLSEGAKEQVAAAVRLAVAELLAGGVGTGSEDILGTGAVGDGSLPVVFDDAFAYSDPERVLTLQRMLDLAASRGLQVIVLTCNPADYALLGARQVMLQRGE